MARKSRPKPTSPQALIREAVLAGIEGLYDKHCDEFLKFREESDAKSGTINFAVKVDESKSEPVVEVNVRFSQSVTDAVKTTLDPNQTKFDFISRSDKKKRGSKSEDNGEGVQAEKAEAE